MTIRRATTETEIKVGDFIAGASALVYGICGRPGQVTRISGKRIYYDRQLQDGSGKIESTHMNRDQVRFVCDTKEELNALMLLNESSYRDTSRAVENIERQFACEFEVRLIALIDGAA